MREIRVQPVRDGGLHPDGKHELRIDDDSSVTTIIRLTDDDLAALRAALAGYRVPLTGDHGVCNPRTCTHPAHNGDYGATGSWCDTCREPGTFRCRERGHSVRTPESAGGTVPDCTTCGRAVRIGASGPEHVEPAPHVNGIHVPTLPESAGGTEDWCSCTGDTATRMHPRGVTGCAHAPGDYGVPRCPVDNGDCPGDDRGVICTAPCAGGTSLTRCETCGAPSLLCEHAPARAGGTGCATPECGIPEHQPSAGGADLVVMPGPNGTAGTVGADTLRAAAGYVEQRDATTNAAHIAERPGKDGLGYGRCLECGETWPCPPNRAAE